MFLFPTLDKISEIGFNNTLRSLILAHSQLMCATEQVSRKHSVKLKALLNKKRFILVGKVAASLSEDFSNQKISHTKVSSITFDLSLTKNSEQQR